MSEFRRDDYTKFLGLISEILRNMKQNGGDVQEIQRMISSLFTQFTNAHAKLETLPGLRLSPQAQALLYDELTETLNKKRLFSIFFLFFFS